MPVMTRETSLQQPTRLRKHRNGARWISAAISLIGMIGLVSLVSCAAQPAATISVPVIVTAGPVCPVETDPPDPACADRPVAGAELVVVDSNGRRVTTVRTDSAGKTSISVPVGSYTVRPQPVPGLMGTPAEIRLVVDSSTPTLAIGYDTGIR
jgi:hypothetical protein